MGMSIGCAIQKGFDIVDRHLIGRARQAGAFDRRRRPVEFEDRGGVIEFKPWMFVAGTDDPIIRSFRA